MGAVFMLREKTMNMREAWEAECKKFNLNPDYNKLWKEKFEAGYAAAIEAVKAGGVMTWMLGDDVYRVKQVRLFTHPPGQEIPGQIPLYKLPEDVA